MRHIERLAIGLAWAGGAVLLALVALVCLSVAGRALGDLGLPGLGPIRGDFELVEAGIGFAIFAFLPLCQLRGGHARADLLAGVLRPALRRGLDLLWEALFALCLLLIFWRLGVATAEKSCLPARLSGDWCNIETSFRLGLPIWWAYLACLAAAALAPVAALARLVLLWRGAPGAQDGGGAL